MASYPPASGFDPREQRRSVRDQARVQRDMYRAQARTARLQMRGLRRTSGVGPVLLIAAGIVLLLIQTGQLSSMRVWGWYARWWPSILVAAGVLLLAEWAWDQYRLRDPNTPPYRRSLGGGVFAVLLLVTVAGIIGRQARDHFGDGRLWPGLHLGPDNIDEFLGDRHEFDQTLDLPFKPGSALEISNPRGDVTLRGISDDGRIHIAVHKQVYSRSDAEADTKARQLQPRNENAGSTFRLTLPNVEGGRADLVITVPAESSATITSDRGDIHVASVKAPVTATANHGNIELSAISGVAAAHVNGGDSSVSAHSLGNGLSVEGHAQDVTLSEISGPVNISGEFFGTTHLQKLNGPVHFRTSRTEFQVARLDGEIEISPHMELTADQVVGPLLLTTSNRNVRLERIQGDISVTNRNGSIDLSMAPELGAVSVQNRNGSVNATVPEHSSFSVQASTSDGDIRTDFQLNSHGSGEHRELDGSVGSGGPAIHITTTHGDIAIRQGTILPLPPAAPVSPKLTSMPAMPKGSAGRMSSAVPSTPPPPAPGDGR